MHLQLGLSRVEGTLLIIFSVRFCCFSGAKSANIVGHIFSQMLLIEKLHVVSVVPMGQILFIIFSAR